MKSLIVIVASVAAVHTARADDAVRPAGTSVGIGLGYDFSVVGATLSTPDVTSVRVRLPSGLTFEPHVTFSHRTQDSGDPNVTDSPVTDVEIGGLVRVPLARRGRADLDLIGAFDVARESFTGPGSTHFDHVSVGWGLGVGYWLSPHWQVSATATTPLYARDATRIDGAPTTSVTTYGLSFDPTVMAMVHLFL